MTYPTKNSKNATDPFDAPDLATKAFINALTRLAVTPTLGTPQTDGSLTTDGALQTFTTATTITDAIDDLTKRLRTSQTILLLRKLILQD